MQSCNKSWEETLIFFLNYILNQLFQLKLEKQNIWSVDFHILLKLLSGKSHFPQPGFKGKLKPVSAKQTTKLLLAVNEVHPGEWMEIIVQFLILVMLTTVHLPHPGWPQTTYPCSSFYNKSSTTSLWSSACFRRCCSCVDFHIAWRLIFCFCQILS